MAHLSLRLKLVWVLAAAGLILATAACSRGESSGVEVVQPDPTSPPASLTPAETPGPLEVRGLLMPLEGACLPEADRLMPNAPRDYRSGVHEGVDFYSFESCTDVGRGTPVRAAKMGRVVRADHSYEELTPESLALLEERVASGGANDADVIDAFRGRQVWIDHGGGLLTRYAHLSAVDEGIEVGMVVQAGTVVGYVGDSGTPESVQAPGSENHLHFEIRVGEGFLGQGLPPDEVRALYQQALAPEEAP